MNMFCGGYNLRDDNIISVNVNMYVGFFLTPPGPKTVMDFRGLGPVSSKSR